MSDDGLVGVKALSIDLALRYPIVSAYEFDFIKDEKEVQDYLRPCTLYLIVQRPLMVIDEVRGAGGLITFTVSDDANSAPLSCEIDLFSAGIIDEEDGDPFLDVQFYRPRNSESDPLNEVAGFKVLDSHRKFKAWVTAESFLWYYFKNRPGFNLVGDPLAYMDYQVHYVGKAFDQSVWKRLTGHEKMQKILTREQGRNVRSLGASFEISLMMLSVLGFKEQMLMPYIGYPAIREPILHSLSDGDAIGRFMESWVKPSAAELTSEAEAMLIRELRPAYNTILYNNYPNIESGVRSKGYSGCDLNFCFLPATLRTEFATLRPIVRPGLDQGG